MNKAAQKLGRTRDSNPRRRGCRRHRLRDVRGIYVITDTKTGQEFIGVSGVGISETGLHTTGKATVQDER